MESNTPKIPEMPQKQDVTVLTSVQIRAIEMLFLGQSTTYTAAKLGVDRKTLYTWRKNPHFRAELNRRRQEALEAVHQRLRSLSEKAVDVIEQHLDEGSLNAATALLKIVATLPKPDIETSPQTLLKRQSEESLWNYWHRQPFAEKRFGRYTMNNSMFTEFCDDIHTHELRRFGIEFESDVDDAMNALVGVPGLEKPQKLK